MPAEDAALPAVPPNRRYFTIGEVSRLCLVKDHVLRHWEKQFPMLRPRRRQGRRYYQPEDVRLVRQIRSLLQEQGYTVEGARSRLQGEAGEPAAGPAPGAEAIREAVAELERAAALLRG